MDGEHGVGENQVSSLEVPTVAGLRSIATTGSVAQQFIEAEHRPVDANNLNVSHVAAIVEAYARSRGWVL